MIIKKLFYVGFFNLHLISKKNFNKNIYINYKNKIIINPVFLYRKIKKFLILFKSLEKKKILFIYNTNLYISKVLEKYSKLFNYCYFFGNTRIYLIMKSLQIVESNLHKYNSKNKSTNILKLFVLLITDSVSLIKNSQYILSKYYTFVITNYFINIKNINFVYFNINSVSFIRIFITQLYNNY